MFFVQVENRVWKYLSRLPKDQRLRFTALLRNLKEKKDGHRLLSSPGIEELWEFKLGPHRVYYFVNNNVIVVSEITYEGHIISFEAGDKNSQEKDIYNAKKRFGLK